MLKTNAKCSEKTGDKQFKLLCLSSPTKFLTLNFGKKKKIFVKPSELIMTTCIEKLIRELTALD